MDQLSTYGLLRNKTRTEIRTIVGQLEADGYLLTETEHQTIRLLPLASQVLYHGKRVEMLVRKEMDETPTKHMAAAKMTYEESDLYDMLRMLRATLAQEADVPAYVIFSNATLQDMARKKPRTIGEFKRVSGIGELKATWYGKAFLEVIKNYLADHQA